MSDISAYGNFLHSVEIPRHKNFMQSVLIEAPPAGNWRAEYSLGVKEEEVEEEAEEEADEFDGRVMLERAKKKRKVKPSDSSEEMAATEDSRKVLASLPRLTFTSHSSCAEINTWLTHLGRLHPRYNIHPTVISYTNMKRKRNELMRIARGPLPQAFKDAERRDWNLPSCLSSALISLRNAGTILLFCAPIWNPVQLRDHMIAFHTYVIIYKNNTLIIADPGYEWEEPNVVNGQVMKWRDSELTYGLGLATALIKMARKTHRVEKCWYGKGSKMEYDDTNGNVMSQDFILEYLEGWADKEVDWEKEGFVELVP